jgi:smad nuclear-interacting protein 1
MSESLNPIKSELTKSRKRERSENTTTIDDEERFPPVVGVPQVAEAIPAVSRSHASSSSSDAPSAPVIEKPSFALSGALTKDASSGLVTLSGQKLKFVEPPEARLPDKKWRLHVFKGESEIGEPLRLHRQSCFLFGKDKQVAEIHLEHPSCSKQHAVIQFRLMTRKEDNEGLINKPLILPYVIDLNSTNGTYLNGKRIESSRYIELRPSDVLRFGESSREFVLLHEDVI